MPLHLTPLTPLAGNGGSMEKCRRRWDLADDETLKFKFMNSYDRAMTHLDKAFGFMNAPHTYISRKCEMDKVSAARLLGCLCAPRAGLSRALRVGPCLVVRLAPASSGLQVQSPCMKMSHMMTPPPASSCCRFSLLRSC